MRWWFKDGIGNGSRIGIGLYWCRMGGIGGNVGGNIKIGEIEGIGGVVHEVSCGGCAGGISIGYWMCDRCRGCIW